ncbi:MULTISPECIES: hypothetical protein [unclassified Wenzhouxiangella]|uniref:hypothetical protein n=1 Tax=unclassified Wenzhouxiangella TaxID=2613841 RepID=UPI0011C043DD|nr:MULTISPECIES: hypothetical protein [unclassified Wenzhouxiangella]
MLTRTITALLLALVLGACSALADSFTLADGSTHDGDVSLINGRIEIGSDCEVKGEISNVNGRIQIGGGSRALDISNVNGRIELGEGVAIDGDVSSVNGRIELGRGSRVTGELESVNGQISADGVEIDGQVSSVNGSIEMRDSRAESLVTNNSSIMLDEGAFIAGALTVRKSQGINFNAGSPPKIVIGREVTVEGPLKFERDVELFVHETATVGEITGAEAVHYSGDEP